nr:hypothetical protein [Tanacetum cinerariifolium]
MKQLEKDKKALQLGPDDHLHLEGFASNDKKALQLGPDDHLHLEGFASNVFAKADKQDRAGRADL